MNLALESDDFESRAVSPLLELGAYEALWDRQGSTFKKIADMFKSMPDAIPSDFVSESECLKYASFALQQIAKSGIEQFGVRVHGAGEYPIRLRDAKHPIELLYYRGWWDLAETRSIAVVGTRNPSSEGIARTKKLTKCLVEDGYTVVSGLAKGVDTAAHNTAIALGGRTISVIGTPITKSYPKENARLQELIADKYLLISQVPIYRYSKQGPRQNRFFFPERNITMSALTEATIIVEAGETSGTLIQARAALQQGRKLFILDSCFKRSDLTWPKKYESKGAIRVKDYDDIRKHLGGEKVNRS